MAQDDSGSFWVKFDDQGFQVFNFQFFIIIFFVNFLMHNDEVLVIGAIQKF